MTRTRYVVELVAWEPIGGNPAPSQEAAFARLSCSFPLTHICQGRGGDPLWVQQLCEPAGVCFPESSHPTPLGIASTTRLDVRAAKRAATQVLDSGVSCRPESFAWKTLRFVCLPG